MKNHLVTSILFILIVCTLNISAQNTYTKTITVQPYQELQNYEHFKRLVLISDDVHVEYIEGFNFEWGFEYTLKVEVTKLSPELSDGTQYEYKLDSILSKTKVPDTIEFKLFIDPYLYYRNSGEENNSSLKAINDSTFLYLDEIEIEVPKELLALFKNIIKGEHGEIGHFVFVNEKRIRLRSL